MKARLNCVVDTSAHFLISTERKQYPNVWDNFMSVTKKQNLCSFNTLVLYFYYSVSEFTMVNHQVVVLMLWLIGFTLLFTAGPLY